MDLVGTVIERLKRLRVKQAYKEIERVVVIWDNSVERDLFLAQRVKVHVVMVGQGLNLRQIERREADSRTHQDRFRSLARNELSRTFYQKNKQQYYLLHYACCVCHLAV